MGVGQDTIKSGLSKASKYLKLKKKKNSWKVRAGRERSEWASAVNSTSILWVFIFSLPRPTRPSTSSHPPPSIPRCTQETLAPLKVESVFLFHCVFFPPRWKSPHPTLAERLTQVCSDVPTFLDSIPNTGTVYRLSQECWFPAQVFIRPSLGRECNRNSLSNTSHYTTQTFPPCQSSLTQTNAGVCFFSFYNIRCKASAGSSYEK